jgi:hypothetical protein
MTVGNSRLRSIIASSPRLNRMLVASEDSLRRQRDAATDKAIAQTKESAAKTVNTNIEIIRKLVPAVLLSYGLIAAFVYFFCGN